MLLKVLVLQHKHLAAGVCSLQEFVVVGVCSDEVGSRVCTAGAVTSIAVAYATAAVTVA